MLTDLGKLNPDKSALKKNYIEKRLNLTTYRYLHELTNQVLSIYNRNALKLLKKVEETNNDQI